MKTGTNHIAAKWSRQGQWRTEHVLAECVEVEGWGIIGAWISTSGDDDVIDGIINAHNSQQDLIDLLTSALPYVEEGEEFNHPRKRELSRRIKLILNQLTTPPDA